jgi:alpha-L-rhamnosidase
MQGAPVRLRCEYLDDPIGIETARPRLSWWPNDARGAELQTGFQIQAASTLALLEGGDADFWDSGHVAGQQTLNVEYAGRPLPSGARVWWRVRCFDSDGVASPWSDAARFELGLLAPDDWQAGWISSPLCGSPTTPVPAPLLWRDFELSRAPVLARLYVAVLGAGLWEINGRPVGNDEPVGTWCDLTTRVPYRIYDVTDLLAAGPNRLGVVLGDGVYCGPIAGGSRQQFGDRPAVCAQLVLESPFGERRLIGTDAGWRWRPSWILRGDRDGGEEVDGRQVLPRWSLPSRLDGYAVVERRDLELLRFCPSLAPPVVRAEHRVADPVRELQADGNVRIRYDFGCTVLGRLRVRMRSRVGSVLALRYGDVEPVSGILRWDEAIDRYAAVGEDSEVFEPRFAFRAFRWIEIVSPLEPHEIDEVVALEIGLRSSTTAEFRCDHRLLERLFEVAGRTCRMGLALGPVTGLLAADRRVDTADAAAILTGAGATLEAGAAFVDWARALFDIQSGTDASPVKQPFPARPSRPAANALADDAGLEESALPLLWHLYRCEGNRRLLEQAYPGVQRHLQGRGERCARFFGGGEVAGSVVGQLREMLWYGYALSLATRMAGVLGRLADLEHYDSLGGRLRLACRARFVTRAGLLAVDDQLSYLLGLELGLFEEVERPTAIGRLEAQLRANSFRPGVDLRHGALLLEVLVLEDKLELAYQVLLQTGGPSWLATIHAGASVLWDPVRKCGGRMALAGLAGWLQRFLLGLDLDSDLTPELNAYRRMRIQPRPPLGPEFAAGPPIRHAAGHLDTVHGRYECAWNISADGFRLWVRVPGNCSARIILPDGYESLVAAGEHEFYMAVDPRETGETPAPSAAEVPLLSALSSGT